ncbi:FecCD family ABC transporter permease [Enterococcus sp. LJL120]
MSKKVFAISSLSCLILLVFIISLLSGSNQLSLETFWQIIQGGGTAAQRLLLINFRFPRTLVAILAGAGLAFAGFLLQGVTRNDLADSSILGINSGAGLFVLLYLGFFSDGTRPWLLPLFASIGSLLAGSVVYLTAHRRHGGITVNRLLLAGIAVNAGISALTLFLTVNMSEQTYNFVTSWLAGSIWGVSWQYVLILTIALIILLPITLTQIKALEVLGFGDEAAISLGVKIKNLRQVSLLLAVLIAGCCVSMAGSISFVGLLAPHAAKRLLGSAKISTYLTSGLIGALFVLAGDTLGKNILAAGEIPAGILVALIGAPYFVFLLMRKSY